MYSDRDRQREYQRQWIANRRAAWIAQNGPCVDCKSWNDLEVDHQDRQDKISHKVWSWSTERRMKELAKCCVRCRECHQEKTRIEIHGTPKHGRRNMYLQGCRCHLCKTATVEYDRAQWIRKRSRSSAEQSSRLLPDSA